MAETRVDARTFHEHPDSIADLVQTSSLGSNLDGLSLHGDILSRAGGCSQSSVGRRREALTCERFFFLLSRRSFEALVGRDARRFFSTRRLFRTNSASRSRATSRF